MRPAIVHRAHLAIACIARLLSCNLAVLRSFASSYLATLQGGTASRPPYITLKFGNVLHVPSRSTPPQRESIRFRLALRTYDAPPWHGVGVHRTRGEPNEIKKNPHPENINNPRSFLCAGRAELIHSMRYGSKKRFLTNGTRLKWIGGRNLRIWRGKREGM